MTNKDFAVAVTKFFFYANNYPCVEITYPTLFEGNVTKFLPEFFNAFDKFSIEHLLGKFNYRYEKAHGYSASALIEFFADLDGKNRANLLKWVNEHYTQDEDFGLSLSTLKDEEVA